MSINFLDRLASSINLILESIGQYRYYNVRNIHLAVRLHTLELNSQEFEIKHPNSWLITRRRMRSPSNPLI